VAGVPLSSVADCRLVVGPSGCDDVVVGEVGVVVGDGKETQLVLFPVYE